jgi:6-phospho-beta-glucosidase
MKLCIIGGGSSYTPELIDGIIKRKDELYIDKIVLVDILKGQEKQSINTGLARRMFHANGIETVIEETLSLDDGIKDADYVITQLRVGGLEARGWDEKIPLGHDLIGQETTGAGGFSKAMRTLPVLMNIAYTIEKFGNKAILINFTNPAGMITEGLLKHTQVKTIGLCNVPLTMRMNIAKMMDVDYKDITLDYIGLNHLVYGKKVFYKGKDITETVLTRMQAGASFTMKNIPDLAFQPELLKALSMIPCPYHRYFYHQTAMLKEEINTFENTGMTRADQVVNIEGDLFEIYKDTTLKAKPKELENRGGAYYSDAAISLLSAIHNDKQEIHTVNVLNKGAIMDVPDDAVIEVNAIIDRRGARPLVVGRLPESVKSLVTNIKHYERLAIESIVNQDKNLALQALIAHPLVQDAEKAIAVLDELEQANKKYYTFKE